MVFPVVSAELRRFCQTTSIRGVPRIVNSKSTVHSIIWTLGVLMCTGILIWQVALVFMRYQSYPVNTVSSESPEWDNATFPDITICNLNSLVYQDELPISYSNYVKLMLNQLSFTEFMKFYPLYHNEANVTLAIKYYNAVLANLVNAFVYFANFGITGNITKPAQNSPILECSYFDWNLMQMNTYDCIGSIQEITDPDYYKCYTLRLNKNLRKSTRGFSAVIYVKKIVDNTFANYFLSLRDNFAKGMKVLIHDPGTMPNMQHGIGIEAGKSTTIALQQTKITRLPEPYSNCTTRRTLENLEGSPSYSKTACIDICLQELYIKGCGCILTMIHQYTKNQLQRTNNTLCGTIGITNLNSSIDWNGIEQILCTDKILKVENTNACNMKCPLPCEEYRNSATVYANSWPAITSQIPFYYTYIEKNRTSKYSSKFDEYMLVFDNYFTNKTAALNILEKLDREGLIQDSFLQLDIQFNSNAYQKVSSVVAFPLDAFGAQIGGVLSLWLGMTVLLIFEICEFFINLISAVWSGDRNQVIARETVETTKP